MLRLASALLAGLALLGCPKSAPEPSSTSPLPPKAPPVVLDENGMPPEVDMRGCVVHPAALERALGATRAAHDCPAQLRDETRRQGDRDVTWSWRFNLARTDDVRARAVPNACCYDKRFHSAQ